MKREASMAPPIFTRASREIEWFDDVSISEQSPSIPSTKEEKVFEWIVWTLVTFSLLLAVLGGIVIVHGVLQFDFPLWR